MKLDLGKSRPIALFSASLDGGGAERVMVTLANGFYRAGYDVDMVLVKSGGVFINELAVGINIVDFGKSRTLFALIPLVHYLRLARPVAMLSTQIHVNLIAVFAYALARVPLNLFVREATTLSEYHKHIGTLISRIIILLANITYSASTKVIAPSQGVADDLIRSFGILPSKVVVIPNPLDFNLIHKYLNGPFPDLGLNNCRLPIILGVGRLDGQKDFTSLILAFSIVMKTNKARLIILGEGEDRKALQDLIKSLNLEKHVELKGFVENPFVYMRQATVFVLSSRFEGMPNTLLQALALGIPSVATDCPSGPKEILEGGKWGRLIKVGDVNAMAEAIIDGIQGHLTKPPIELIESRYEIHTIAKKYLDILLNRSEQE